MLVLSRKSGQSIAIGHDVKIQVVQVQGGRVKLAIQAPNSVSIRRAEIVLSPEQMGLLTQLEVPELLEVQDVG